MPEAAVLTARDVPAPAAAAGSLLRAAALAPAKGFPHLFRFASGTGAVPASRAGSLLTAAAGASLMLSWLKIGGLLGIRTFAASSFRWSYLVGALAIGVVIALAARAVWASVLGRRRGPGSAPRLRLIWGAASVPQIPTLLLLLPVDLAVNGRFAFIPSRPPSAAETLWAALSIALSLSLLVWSTAVLGRGIQASERRSSLASVVMGTGTAAASILLTAIGVGLAVSLLTWVL